MAAGDLKGPECVVIKAAVNAALAKGVLVVFDTSIGKYKAAAAAAKGKFGVTCEASSADGDVIKICIGGRVEVTASAAAIAKGSLVEAGASVVVQYGGTNPPCGTAMEAFGASETRTVWIGMVA